MTLRRIDKVTVENWRNWQGETTVDGLVDGVVVLAGPNAVGKTGLWEAIVGGLLDRHWGTHTARLRPAGTKGVMPRVEIEFTAGGSRYRVEKHFGSARDKASFWEWHSGEWLLRAQGEEAYQACRQAALGTDGSAPTRGGRANALKDTLMDVLLPAQGQLTSHAPAPDAVSMAITDREAATAATRVGRVLDAVSAEAGGIWVGKRDRPKVGSALQIDETQLDKLDEQIGPLEAKAAHIGELVGRLSKISEEAAGQDDAAKLATLADQLRREAAEHRKRREVAKESLEAAAGAAAEIKALSAERAARDKAVADAATELAARRRELEDCVGDRKRERSAFDSLKEKHETLDLDARRHREWIEFESRESELDNLQKALDGIVERTGRVEAQERELDRRQAEAQSLRVPETEEWSQLDRLSRGLQEARGELKAGAWSVAGDLPSGLTLRIDGNEIEAIGVDRQATREVEIGGADERTLRIAAPVRSADRVERLEAEQGELLDRYRVADLGELRHRYNYLEQEVKPAILTARSRLQDALGGGTKTDLLQEQIELEALISKKKGLMAPSFERPEGAAQEWNIHLRLLTPELEEVGGKLVTAGPRIGALDERVNEAEKAIARCGQDVEETEATLEEHRENHGPNTELAQAVLRTESVEEEARRAWMEFDESRPMAEQAKETRAEKLTEGLGDAMEMRAKIGRLSAEIEALRREDPETALAGLEAERAALRPRIRAARTHAEALLLLESSLTEEKNRVTEAIGEPVRERLQKWVEYLLQDKSEVVVDADGRPAVIRTPAGQEVEYEDQSYGTREQVSILHRLAVADLVAEEVGAGVVLMLDDPFGHTDRGRRSRMLDILTAETENRGHQILIFTCRAEDFEGVGTHIALER